MVTYGKCKCGLSPYKVMPRGSSFYKLRINSSRHRCADSFVNVLAGYLAQTHMSAVAVQNVKGERFMSKVSGSCQRLAVHGKG